jgi:hypothetical protein
MNLQQLVMLAAEAAFMAAIVIGLFRARTVLGLTPLYIVLGGMQYLEATLTLRIELMPGIIMFPASTVLFPATLMSVLLIYVKDDAIEARKLVYGLTLANLAAAVISLLIGWHLTIPGTTVSNLRARDFLGSAWISTAGTGLLLVDVIGIILCYEFIGRYVRGLFCRSFCPCSSSWPSTTSSSRGSFTARAGLLSLLFSGSSARPRPRCSIRSRRGHT